MRYVAILKRENEVLRFFNSLTEQDAVEANGGIKLLSECCFISARDAKGIVNDGLVPIIYDPKISAEEIETAAAGRRGDNIVATLLLAAGFCAKRIKRRSEGGGVGLSKVKELSELLLRESRSHFALLHKFEQQDKNRMYLYDTPISMWLDWMDLSRSAENLECIAEELQIVVGEPELA